MSESFDSLVGTDSRPLCSFEDERHDVRLCKAHPGGAIHEDYYAEAMREVEDGSGPSRTGPRCSLADSRPPNPEKDGLDLMKQRREIVWDVLYNRAQRTGSGGSPSWWTPHWRAWYRDGADEICAALEANDADEVTHLRSELAAYREAVQNVAAWALGDCNGDNGYALAMDNAMDLVRPVLRESRSLNGEEGAHV